MAKTPKPLNMMVVRELVQNAVRNAPEGYVYAIDPNVPCTYRRNVNQGIPAITTGCLVAEAFRLSPLITPEMIKAVEEAGTSVNAFKDYLKHEGAPPVVRRNNLKALCEMLSPKAIEYLQVVQTAQDIGVSWEKAVKIADNLVFMPS